MVNLLQTSLGDGSMGNEKLYIGLFLVLSILGGIILAFFVSYMSVLSVTGKQFEVVVTVKAVEHGSSYGEYTAVLDACSFPEKSYKFIGYVDLKAGRTYRIVFEYHVWFMGWLGFEARGEILEVEELSDKLNWLRR